MPLLPSSSLVVPNDPRPKLALIAGEGGLPLLVLKEAIAAGWQVFVYLLNRPWWQQRHEAKTYLAQTPHVFQASVSQPKKWFTHAGEQGCRHVVLAGKVNKWQVFTRVDWDSYSRHMLKTMTQKHDDGIMQVIVEKLYSDFGLTVLPQTDFMQSLFVPSGILASPTAEIPEAVWRDATYGYQLALHMGRLDVGQSVVVNDGMPIAIEAIEGTDACIQRSGRWMKRKGGMLVKVAKPLQDNRFDVPTVGLRTLRRMRQAGLTWLVIEANRTIVTDKDAMITYAHRYGLGLLSVDAEMLAPYTASVFREQTNAESLL